MVLVVGIMLNLQVGSREQEFSRVFGVCFQIYVIPLKALFIILTQFFQLQDEIIFVYIP